MNVGEYRAQETRRCVAMLRVTHYSGIYWVKNKGVLPVRIRLSSLGIIKSVLDKFHLIDVNKFGISYCINIPT